MYYSRKTKEILGDLRRELVKFVAAVVEGSDLGIITLEDRVISRMTRDEIVSVEHLRIDDHLSRTFLVAITERDKEKIMLDIDDENEVHLDDIVAIVEQLEKRVAFIHN